MTIKVAARILGCSPNTIHRLIKRRRLPARQVGHMWLLTCTVDHLRATVLRAAPRSGYARRPK